MRWYRFLFFACNILLLKFATATRYVSAILVVAIIALIVNVVASLIFMSFMNVPGIALGASLSIMVSTVFLLAILVWHRHIDLIDAVTLMLSWMLFVTLLISVQFSSTPGIIITLFTFIVLLAGYGSVLFRDDRLAGQV